MKIERILILAALALPLHPAVAQPFDYDPLFSEACTPLHAEEAPRWEHSAWMWHPGQLAAFLQAGNLSRSKARCTYVGYPGNYYKQAELTHFRRTISLKKASLYNWKASGPTRISLDGNILIAHAQEGSISVPRGRHLLEISVEGKGRTPAILFKGLLPEGFEASTDGKQWNPVEWDFNESSPEVLPDREREITLETPVREWHLLRGATLEDESLTLGEHGCAVADFHYLELGNVVLNASGEGEIVFTFGESIEEALTLSDTAQEQVPLSPVALSGQAQEIILPERGLRYVGIRASGSCRIDHVRFRIKSLPVKRLLTFECPDQEFMKILEAAMATQHASMHNFYLDGVKRDFLPWAMDAVVSSIGGDYAFGERQLSRNGISIALLPDGATREDLGVVDYPLHALIGLWEEYLRYGDLSTSRMYRSRIEGQMALYEMLQDEHGFISSYDKEWGFIPGWDRDNGPENIGTPAYPQMLLLMNFEIAGRFELLWGNKQKAKAFQACADRLRDSILTHFWDRDQHAFVNGYFPDGTLDTRLSHHTQSWAVIAGIFPEEYLDNLFGEVLPSMDYYKKDISYEKGYEALAYIRSGRTAQFVTLLKDVWGRWLDAGNTRFPENFRIEDPFIRQLEFYSRPYGLSLCHGANGVPPIVTAVFGILGLRVHAPGVCSLEPDLVGMEYASGKIPLSCGMIEVELRRQGTCRVSIPSGCSLTVSGKTFSRAGTYEFYL